MQLGGFLEEHVLQAQTLVVVISLGQAPLANTHSLGATKFLKKYWLLFMAIFHKSIWSKP